MVFCIVLMGGAYAAESIVKMYSEEAAPDGSRFKNTDEGEAAALLDVKGGKFVGLVIPSWYDPPTSTVILVYKWDKDYKTTLSKKPIYTDKLDDLSNTGWVDPGEKDFRVDFERAFAEGKYLLVFRKSAHRPLHIPTHAAYADSVAYFNGSVYENVSYRISCIVDPDAELNEEPNLKIEESEFVIAAYGDGGSTDGESYFSVANYDSVGQKVSVTEGKFVGFVINSLFLQEGHAEINFKVFEWKGNYADTVKEEPIYYTAIEAETGGPGDHPDYRIDFGKAFAEGEYLVLFESEDGLCLWSHGKKAGITSFMDGQEYTHGTFKLSYIVDIYAELDTEPETEIPTEPETNVPTGDNTLSVIIACIMVVGLAVSVRRKAVA